MALIKRFETKSGISVENAYWKIVEQSGNKDNINLRLRPFVSQEKADVNIHIEGEDKIINFAPSVSDNSTNFIKQGYEYLKTLDEYKDATDC